MLNALLALKGLDPPFFRTIVAPFFSCSEPSGWKPPASGGTPSSRRAVSLARRTAVCVLSLSHGPSVRVGASLSAKFYLLAEPVPRRWAEHNNRRDDGDILQSARPTSWKYSAAESNESQMRSSHSCRLFILQRRLFSFFRDNGLYSWWCSLCPFCRVKCINQRRRFTGVSSGRRKLAIRSSFFFSWPRPKLLHSRPYNSIGASR